MQTPAFISSIPLLPRAHKPPLISPLHTPRRTRAPTRPRLHACQVNPEATVPEPTLTSFAAAVQGEWVGYEGSFQSDTGAAIPIPDYYIPEEFVEWALVPHGFESNHSITVRGDKLYRKFFRIIPGVSLFADHVDAEEDFKVLPIGGELAIFEDGCYVLSKLDVITRRDSKLDKWPSVDFCLRDPSNDSKRALHVTVSVNVEQSRLVDDVRCVLEKYSCIYCDGANMDGTSGFVEGWVSEQPGSSQSLLGTWSGHDGSKITRTKADMEKWLFLPQGIHIGVTPTLDGGACVHAGWLVNSATCISVRRTFNAQGRVTVSKRVVETLQ